MSDKRQKKNTTKINKKKSKNRKIPTLRPDNDGEIPAKTTYIKDTECFRINDIDIDKIRVSDKKRYEKQYYVFYEHDNDEYIPLKIDLKDVVGYYNHYKDNSKYDVKYSAKRMNFKLYDNSIDRIYYIFEHNEEKLGIDFNSFTYESKAEEYLKTIVSDETLFIKNNKTSMIPNENTKCKCRVVLQI